MTVKRERERLQEHRDSWLGNDKEEKAVKERIRGHEDTERGS